MACGLPALIFNDMRPNFNGPEEIAVALDYLGGAIGTETALDLRSIARALNNITWFLPEPAALPHRCRVCIYRVCIFEDAIQQAEASSGRVLRHARKLLETAQDQRGLKKICVIHRDAGLTPGFDIVAVRGEKGQVSYSEHDDVAAQEAESLLDGAACLFYKY